VLYRDVLVWAANECHLSVNGVPEKSLDASALRRLDSLGKLIGPPWTQDQKYAAVAAFMTLLSPSSPNPPTPAPHVPSP
jgi:hypothetical protein